MKRAYRYFLILALALSTLACETPSEDPAQTYSAYFQTALEDFKTSEDFKNGTAFEVYFISPFQKGRYYGDESINGEELEELLVISIAPPPTMLSHNEHDIAGSTSGFLPTRTMLLDDKLFYWKQEGHPLTEETIDRLRAYRLYQSGYVLYTGPFTITKYFFCKDDPGHFVKVKSDAFAESKVLPSLPCVQP